MAAGTTYRQCGCRGDNGRRLGRKCPKLRRRNGGWSSDHGGWYYQLELPPETGGRRRSPLRRGGSASQGDAQDEMDKARELLAIAADDDPDARLRIADAICTAVRDTRLLPDPGRARKAARLGEDLNQKITVGQWLDQWLAAKKKLRKGTVRSYEAHIRLYYRPHIGQIWMDRLRVADVVSVFEAIDELNDAVAQARATAAPACGRT